MRKNTSIYAGDRGFIAICIAENGKLYLERSIALNVAGERIEADIKYQLKVSARSSVMLTRAISMKYKACSRGYWMI
jgi:hypothetical protein